jgi:AraC-like DNA-binding protein
MNFTEAMYRNVTALGAFPHYGFAEAFPGRQTPIIARHWQWKGLYPRHDHQFMEIQVILRGTGVQQSKAGERPFQRGAIQFLRPGEWHSFEATKTLSGFACCFGSEILHRELAWTMSHPMLNAFLWKGALAEDSPGVMNWQLSEKSLTRCLIPLQAIESCGDEEKPETRPYKIAHLILLLTEIAQGYVSKAQMSSASSTHEHPYVIRAVRFIEENLHQEMNAESLAGHFHLNLSYFGRIFRKNTGLTPLKYLARCRCERAAQMLVGTSKPIGQIAIEVGLPDPNHFARHFRAHFGLSASVYRNKFSEK